MFQGHGERQSTLTATITTFGFERRQNLVERVDELSLGNRPGRQKPRELKHQQKNDNPCKHHAIRPETFTPPLLRLTPEPFESGRILFYTKVSDIAGEPLAPYR